MPEFPASPISPSEFFERFLPKAFLEADLPEELGAVELTLGVRLEGEGGGEWLVHLRGGSARVEPASRATAAFTVVQSVEDWRGALWEGRGGAIGRQAAAVFRPGARPPGAGDLGPPSPAVLAQMQSLSGLVRVCVLDGAGGDWTLGLQLGPGEILAEPTTIVSIRAEDADALERGELNPLEAFMGGRIQVAGDLTLLMQIQAIQMQAASARPAGAGTRSGA
ncbi:MAG: SCP2 sterol-binding domain-containing protein [Candidatus Rokubacteria bacterium]|nr:SCP2 sterol-binding domain-containing protein [Candidatus Rokubacteria bacterium]